MMAKNKLSKIQILYTHLQYSTFVQNLMFILSFKVLYSKTMLIHSKFAGC